MAHCLKCGQLIPDERDADWLLEILTNGQPKREVYRGRDGGWFVTYGGGEVRAAVVCALYDQGAIVSKYSNCPADCYHVGRTIDWDRTMAARKAKGKGAPTYYTDDKESSRGLFSTLSPEKQAEALKCRDDFLTQQERKA